MLQLNAPVIKVADT